MSKYIGYSHGDTEVICSKDGVRIACRKCNTYMSYITYDSNTFYMCELAFKCLREQTHYVDSLDELPPAVVTIYETLKISDKKDNFDSDFYTIRSRVKYPDFSEEESVELFFLREKLSSPFYYDYFIQISDKKTGEWNRLFYVNQQTQIIFIPDPYFVQIPDNIPEVPFESLHVTHREYLKNFLETELFSFFLPKHIETFPPVVTKSYIIKPAKDCDNDKTNLFK